MFIIYDCPMQIFSGNPSQGLMEPEFMQFLGSFPTTWDETRILEAKVSDYIITARRKENDWYVAGMTDWSPRSMELNMDFIGTGKFKAILCKDGINADKYPSDYLLEELNWQTGKPLEVYMAPGGGFVLKLAKIAE
jgi:alpha-glucosidase